MFNRFTRKPLRLELPDRAVGFDTPSDFEFSLASRIEVPAAKIAELMGLGADALKREAASIRDVERRFVEVLAKSLEETGAIGYLMRDMDPKLFSQDHQWRAIMTSLIKQGHEYDEFKKIALVKYMQYLGSRQDVLRSVYSSRPRDAAPEAEPDAGAEAAHRETVIFDVGQFVPAPRPGERDDLDTGGTAPDDAIRDDSPTLAARPRIERLPRGETVRVPLGADGVQLILSRHPFTLVGGERARLVEAAGPEHRLHAGRNVVGRQPDSDVVVDAGYRDVSRTHLVIDLPGDGAAHLTDLSSHGTFVERGVRLGGVTDG